MGWEDVVCPFPIPLGREDVFKDALGHRPWKGSFLPHNHCLSGLSEEGSWTPENGARASLNMDEKNTCPSHQEIKGKVLSLSVPLMKQKYLNFGSIAFSPRISNYPIPSQATQLVTKSTRVQTWTMDMPGGREGMGSRMVRENFQKEESSYSAQRRLKKKITQKWQMRKKKKRTKALRDAT